MEGGDLSSKYSISYYNIPVISSGLTQLHKGFWLGLYWGNEGGILWYFNVPIFQVMKCLEKHLI